jgi:hypothetical protein
VKEFLDNLYKACASSRADGVDQLFDVIPALLGERKFAVVDSILRDMDLSRVHTSTMYSTVHLVCNYVDQLSEYKTFYQKSREEYARRGEPSERISKLFDKYENGGDPKWKYDPNAPPYKSPDQKSDEKLDAAIARAHELGDKDTEDYLTYYKAEMLRYKDRDRKFREMQYTMGEEEMRKRTIKALRDMADLLDKSTGCWPGIYYCDLPEDPLLKKTFIDGIEVTISYPWPG